MASLHLEDLGISSYCPSSCLSESLQNDLACLLSDLECFLELSQIIVVPKLNCTG
jgi:hypothetical protein